MKELMEKMDRLVNRFSSEILLVRENGGWSVVARDRDGQDLKKHPVRDTEEAASLTEQVRDSLWKDTGKDIREVWEKLRQRIEADKSLLRMDAAYQDVVNGEGAHFKTMSFMERVASAVDEIEDVTYSAFDGHHKVDVAKVIIGILTDEAYTDALTSFLTEKLMEEDNES